MRKRHVLLALAALFGVATFSLAADPLRNLSQKLKRDLKAKPAPLLAVLDFPYSLGRQSTGSYLISERLVTYLVQDGAPVVERHLMERLLAERKMCETGLVDPSTIKTMSKILGVDAVVVGTLADAPDENSTEIMARIVRVETGEILSAASAVVERLWRDAPRLPRIAQARVPVPIAYPIEETNPLIPMPSASLYKARPESHDHDNVERNKLTRSQLAIDGRMKKPVPGTVVRDFPYAPAAVPVAVPSSLYSADFYKRIEELKNGKFPH